MQGNMKCAILSALLLCVVAAVMANAARTEQQGNLQQAHLHGVKLLTYYFDVSKPQLELSTIGSGRPGRTALTVKLAKPPLSQFMPVVSQA